MARNKPSKTGGKRQSVWTASQLRFGTGGGMGGASPPQPTPSASNPPADDEDENTLSSATSGEQNADFNGFRKMTDDEKADVIKEALQNPPPSFLPDNASQRLLWHLGGDNKPTIVSDQQLSAMSGKDIYRQVAGVPTQYGNTLTSQQIANQVMTGDFTQYAQSWGAGGTGGGTAFGRAIYFGASYNEIQNGYGTSRNLRGGQQDSTLFRCKINPKAKGMTYSSLRNAVSREMNSGSKLGRVLRSIRSSDDQETVYALAKGIDYTHDGSWDYHMVYNRGCLFASSKLKHNAHDSRW